MTRARATPYPKPVKELMAEKTRILSQARALSEMGMVASAVPLWLHAANHEERIAPLLEALGRELEAALHRISAASCFQKAGDLSRAANLYRAALAGPVQEDTRQEVEELLRNCLKQLGRSSLVFTGPSNVS